MLILGSSAFSFIIGAPSSSYSTSDPNPKSASRSNSSSWLLSNFSSDSGSGVGSLSIGGGVMGGMCVPGGSLVWSGRGMGMRGSANFGVKLATSSMSL